MTATATSLPDGRIHLTTGAWSDTFEAARLDGWIDFYSYMHRKYGRQSYADVAEALKGVKE